MHFPALVRASGLTLYEASAIAGQVTFQFRCIQEDLAGGSVQSKVNC